MNPSNNNHGNGQNDRGRGGYIRLVMCIMGLPLLFAGMATLIATYIFNFTPNWLLATGLACVLLGAVVYIWKIRYNSRF